MFSQRGTCQPLSMAKDFPYTVIAVLPPRPSVDAKASKCLERGERDEDFFTRRGHFRSLDRALLLWAVRKQADGTKRCRDAHGQPHRVSLKTKNENQANSRYQDFMEQVDRGVLHYSPRPKALPFSEMVDRYLNEGAGRLRPRSRERHEGCFKLHLVPYFKTLSIKVIGVKDVAAYIRFREKKGAAANTIYKELAALSAVFTFLVSDEVLVQNPVLAVQKPKLQVIRLNYT